MNNQLKILIVEDDVDIAELLRVNLQDLDFDCDICYRGDTAVNQIICNQYALIILDLTLPGLDGLEICRQVRQIKPEQSILMLTAKSSELDQIIGLEVGADDYMTKPFSIPALQARVRARIRRSNQYQTLQSQVPANSNKDLVRVGDLVLDSARRLVLFGSHELELTALEFDLLRYFGAHPEQVFSRTQLLDKVWGYDHAGYEHTVNSHINRLRNKIESVAGDKSVIETVWGVGYRLSRKNCYVG